MKTLLSILLLLILSSCSKQSETQEPTSKPPQEKPKQTDLKPKAIALWATYYNMPSFKSVANGIDLRDAKGNKLGLKLTLKDFCQLAMEGSGYVDGKTIHYADKTWSNYVNGCSYAPSGKVKFSISKLNYATGNKDNELIPFVSVACDQFRFKFNQWFFIPDGKGVKLPSGKIHDGWFQCADVGGLIKGNHIDVFIGSHNTNPFNFIKSKETATFDAYIKSQTLTFTDMAIMLQSID